MTPEYNKVYICKGNDNTLNEFSIYMYIENIKKDSLSIKKFTDYGSVEYPSLYLNMDGFNTYYKEATEEDISFLKPGTVINRVMTDWEAEFLEDEEFILE